MDPADPLSTQRDQHFELTAELSAAGFENAEEIGRGGFGVVYRCEQRALDRVVAVKVLAEGLEDENLERFLREQRAMGKLSGHPNIVNVFQVGATASGRPYIVMQYHPHGSLDARVNRDGPIAWQESVHIGVRLAGALGDRPPARHAAPRRQARQRAAHRVRRAATDRLRHRADRGRIRDIGRR